MLKDSGRFLLLEGIILFTLRHFVFPLIAEKIQNLHVNYVFSFLLIQN